MKNVQLLTVEEKQRSGGRKWREMYRRGEKTD